MTNAEKFKEVFGFEFALAPYEADCWCPFQRTKCRDTEFDCFEDCVKPFWQSEYQGEPTIPLSVIEKIKAEINTRRNRTITLFKADGLTKQELTFSDSAYVEVLEIIDKAVREVNRDCTTCTHSDELNGEYCYECVKGIKDNFEEVTKNEKV